MLMLLGVVSGELPPPSLALLRRGGIGAIPFPRANFPLDFDFRAWFLCLGLTS